MKRRGILYRLSAMLICSALALGGCGRGGQGSGSAGTSAGNGAVSDTEQRMAYKDIRYLPEFTDTSERFHASASEGIGFTNDTFYLLRKDYTETYYGYNISGGQVIAYHADTGEENVLLDVADMGAGLMVTAAAAMEDGAVAALLRVDDTGYKLCKLDAEGNEIYSRELLFSGDMINYSFGADARGRCYLLAGGELLFFNEEGMAVGKTDVSGKGMVRLICGKSDTAYLYEWDTDRIVPIDFEGAGLEEPGYSLPIRSVRKIVPSDGEGVNFLICDDTTVYQYSCEEGSVAPLFDFQDSQIVNGVNIDTIGKMEDGRIFLFSGDRRTGATEIVRLTPTPLAECPVKEVVTIGSIYPNVNLMESVAEFNRQSEDFTVSIINYCTGGRSYQEAREAFRLDLSIGKGPDLCDLYSFLEPDPLFASGCFVDLSPYLEESGQYGKEDFVAQALEACTWQGQLMAIPKYFYLETIVGSSDIVGESMGWDMEDVRAVIDGHPDAMIFDSRHTSYLFSVLSRNMLGEFVDFEGKKADFDSPEYVNFLNFLKGLPDHFTEKEEAEYWTNRDRWLREGRALLSCREIFEIRDLQRFDAIFDGKYTCIGYPSPDREPDCIISVLNSYAITAASSHKDMAWQFIEWDHSTQGGELRSPMERGGFPTRLDVFERELDEAMGKGDAEKGGEDFTLNGEMAERDATAEERDLLYSLIESASPYKSAEATILGIMKEEAAYLYDGSKTAEDVAEVTQNRVQLYLNE